MKLQINDTNYPYYKRIFEIIHSHVSKLYPPGILDESSDPVAIMNRWEKKSKSMAKRGLKAALQDYVSNIKDFPSELKVAIDDELAVNELPSLRELQGTVKKTLDRVLKRQQIKSLEEYYIVKEEVIDQASDLSVDVRAFLDKLLSEFESSKKKG